jgi:lysophospholipid acyltransferase (LPLAT)-like uncharacterized protein
LTRKLSVSWGRSFSVAPVSMVFQQAKSSIIDLFLPVITVFVLLLNPFVMHLWSINLNTKWMRLWQYYRKIIVITEQSGLGETTARHLASKGANVVLGARRENKLKQIATEINSTGKGKAIYLKTDVTKKRRRLRQSCRTQIRCN